MEMESTSALTPIFTWYDLVFCHLSQAVVCICDAFLPNEAYVADSKVEQQAFICVKGVVW